MHAVHSRLAAVLEANSSVLRTMEALAPDEIVVTVYEGLAGLPHFSSDDDVDPLHPAVAARRSRSGQLMHWLSSSSPAMWPLPGDTSPHSGRLCAAITWRSLPVWAAANAHEFRPAVVRVATCANRI